MKFSTRNITQKIQKSNLIYVHRIIITIKQVCVKSIESEQNKISHDDVLEN